MRGWLATALLTAFTAYAAFRPARRISTWVASCWLADYRLGFLKRGLPGQLLGEGPLSLHELTVLAWCILGAVVLAAGIAAARIVPACARAHPATATGVFGWWLLLVSAPFAAQQLGLDFGRFDQLTLLLLLAALAALRADGAMRWLAVPLVAVCPLVHEAA
ncbi:MAG: hypothetical protein KDC98_20310, partial [Planctomycetes bacterium]|nr:hypothetical protein [Planctomycetota bacterium]